MRTDQTKRHALATASFTRILLLGVLLSLLAPAMFAADPEIFPLSQVKPGMKGEALTIFAGDQVEKFDLVVIGVMPNFLGPKQSIILVQLLGPKVEHTGVVAGMSGSPVYLEGKLAGALSLKLGIFTKEPLAGVTPIENMLSLPKGSPTGRNHGCAARRSRHQTGRHGQRGADGRRSFPERVLHRDDDRGRAHLRMRASPVRFRSGAVADGARARADDAQFGPRFDKNRKCWRHNRRV